VWLAGGPAGVDWVSRTGRVDVEALRQHTPRSHVLQVLRQIAAKIINRAPRLRPVQVPQESANVRMPKQEHLTAYFSQISCKPGDRVVELQSHGSIWIASGEEAALGLEPP
jgi:hypothetical protein